MLNMSVCWFRCALNGPVLVMEDEDIPIKYNQDKLSESTRLLPKAGSSGSLSQPRPANFDEALEATGVGFFHFILVLVAGWALASDSVEVQCISFVTPLLNDKEHNPDTQLAPSKVLNIAVG